MLAGTVLNQTQLRGWRGFYIVQLAEPFIIQSCKILFFEPQIKAQLYSWLLNLAWLHGQGCVGRRPWEANLFAQLVIVLRSGAWLNVFCISPLLFCFPSPLRLLYLFGGLRGCLKHYNIRKIYFGFFPPLSFSSFLLLHCFSFGRHTNQNTAAGMVGCICLILFSFSFFFSALRVPSPISHLLLRPLAERIFLSGSLSGLPLQSD